MSKWKPEWELCEDGQCDFTGHINPVSTHVILQRCRTEQGNWLYLAVASGDRSDEGGVALAIEHAEEPNAD